VWSFARPYRRRVLAYLATIAAGSVAGLAAPLVLRSLLNDAIPNGDRRLVNVLAVLLVAAALAEGLLSLAGRWLSASVGEGLIYDLRTALYDHVQRMPVAFFTNSQTGTLISRLNNDVVGAQSAVTGTLGTVAANTVTFASTFALMIVLEWRLTLLSLAILPLFVVPSKRVGRRLQDLTRRSMQLNGELNSQMTERFGVAGATLVTLFGAHDAERGRFSGRAGKVRNVGVQTAVYGRSFMLGLSVVAAVGAATIYWVGSQLVIGGDLAAGDLVAMGLLVGRVYPSLTALTSARVEVLTALVSFERVFEVLDAPNPLLDRPGAVALDRPRGEIEFDRVHFSYPAAADTTLASLLGPPTATRRGRPVLGVDEPGTPVAPAVAVPVLADLSFRIEPGQLVAVVGPSGAGKSTLASLVSRLYDVTEGAVRVDGHDVRGVTLASLREAIGVVSQDPHLFHDSIDANLRYARPDATEAELREACRAAQVLDVVEALPEGFATVVGERGYRLSGGEKQRLAIARMLLADPAIVVLDEATSHLDSENEAAVQAALDVALRGRTAVVIAHRLSTITDADQILVLERGRLVERGRHGELLAAGGLYAELYHTLVRDQVAAAD
jgi:ATP-binding cassette, subfamily B, bacterial